MLDQSSVSESICGFWDGPGDGCVLSPVFVLGKRLQLSTVTQHIQVESIKYFLSHLISLPFGFDLPVIFMKEAYCLCLGE